MAVSTRSSNKLASIATVKKGRSSAKRDVTKKAKLSKTRRIKYSNQKSGKNIKKKEERSDEVVKREVKEVVTKPRCCTGCGLRIRDVAVVKLFPCRCSFHRACLINTLESKSCLTDQRCPKCKAWIDYLRTVDDPSLSFTRISKILPYGPTGMPTKGLVLSFAKMNKESVADMISILIDRSEQIIEDLDAEVLLLNDTYSLERRLRVKNMFEIRREEVNKRLEILRQMRQVRAAGGMRLQERHSEDANAQFDFDKEMLRCILLTLRDYYSM